MLQSFIITIATTTSSPPSQLKTYHKRRSLHRVRSSDFVSDNQPMSEIAPAIAVNQVGYWQVKWRQHLAKTKHKTTKQLNAEPVVRNQLRLQNNNENERMFGLLDDTYEQPMGDSHHSRILTKLNTEMAANSANNEIDDDAAENIEITQRVAVNDHRRQEARRDQLSGRVVATDAVYDDLADETVVANAADYKTTHSKSKLKYIEICLTW